MSHDNEPQDSKYEKLSRKAMIQFIVVIAFIAFSWYLFACIVANRDTDVSKDQPLPPWSFLTGTFGDAFGVLTSLFTGLALAGLWYTIQLQRIELSATRDELKSQAESLRRQAFEGTLFQLLRTYGELVSHVETNGVTGRNAIRHMYSFFYNAYGKNGWQSNDEVERQKHAVDVYRSQINNKFGSQLTNCFRTLYHVFKLIDSNPGLKEGEKISYANMARAQLSSSELLVLFYNCAYLGEESEFTPLIEKYGVLKHLPVGELPDRSHKDSKLFTGPEAFMSSSERREHAIKRVQGAVDVAQSEFRAYWTNLWGRWLH